MLTDADPRVEILLAGGSCSALPLSDPWEESFVPEKHVDEIRDAVAELEAGDRLLIDKYGLDDYRGYLAEPDRDPIYDPFLEEGALVPIGLAHAAAAGAEGDRPALPAAHGDRRGRVAGGRARSPPVLATA